MNVAYPISVLGLVLFVCLFSLTGHVNSQPDTVGLPVVRDPDLQVEIVTQDLRQPTSMAFLNDNSIIITQQNGTVRLVSGWDLKEEPILNVSTRLQAERGLLGVEVMDNYPGENQTASADSKTVFLYYTEVNGNVQNRLYRYLWDGHSLKNETLILDLPKAEKVIHNGGKVAIGPDNYLYVVVGNLGLDSAGGKLQNVVDGPFVPDIGAVFRIDPVDGSPAANNPFSSNRTDPLSKYYAYGIRNSFGLAFDPVTGNLWDTENGEGLFDEINLVKPGFNSGWIQLMGPSSRSPRVNVSDDLVNLPGSNYSDPIFSWEKPFGITGIEFLNSTKLGPDYHNSLFVGDWNTGSLYNFQLNSSRSGFILDSELSDLVANEKNELHSVTFGSGFAKITDIKMGPDGLLYILGHGFANQANSGSIYRIKPIE